MAYLYARKTCFPILPATLVLGGFICGCVLGDKGVRVGCMAHVGLAAITFCVRRNRDVGLDGCGCGAARGSGLGMVWNWMGYEIRGDQSRGIVDVFGIWNLEIDVLFCRYDRSLGNGFRFSQFTNLLFLKAQQLSQHLISMLP
jgi:hypothetical protein